MTITEPTTARPTDATASQVLAEFIRDQAERAKSDLDFGWVGTPTAPSTYQQLRGAFLRSVRTGEPLPISNEFCDSSIYAEPDDNVRFRFWHDVSHVRLGLSFALGDELELALWHLSELEAAGHARGSDVFELLEADLVGQVLLFALARRFPIDQRTFVSQAQREGLMQGLLTELRRLT